jgi:predicted peptidase
MSLTRYFALLACVASLVAADKPEKAAVAPAEKPVSRTELKAQVAPGVTLKFDFPELTVDRKGAPAACHLTLPANYDATKKVPLVVWLAGGEGGNQPNKSFLPEGDFVIVGLPYPKGANNPAQANMVGDYAKVWAYHRFMLEEIAKVVPNLDRSRSIIAGFSNGGHAIDGMLRLSSGPKLTDFFGIFLFADGGGTAYSSKGNLPDLKGKFAYACWGELKGSNKPATSQLPKALKAKGATVVGSEMAGVGHAFAETEKPKVAEWLEKVALAAPAKK